MLRTMMTAIALTSASLAYASNWIGPYGNPGCYYDAQSVRRVNQNWMTVWVRCIDNPTYAHLLEIGCPGRMWRHLNSIDSVTGGQSGSQTAWSPIPPDSNADALHGIVCRHWPY